MQLFTQFEVEMTEGRLVVRVGFNLHKASLGWFIKTKNLLLHKKACRSIDDEQS